MKVKNIELLQNEVIETRIEMMVDGQMNSIDGVWMANHGYLVANH